MESSSLVSSSTAMTVRSGLRIAVVGCRGIPAGYGGFETFAEELCPRLVELGHDVTVYCRNGYTGEELLPEYKGVKLRYPPHIRRRTLEQLSHEAACILDSLRHPFDLYYFLGTRSAPLYVPLRAGRRIVVVNTDGLEWRRRKWSLAGRSYLRFAEWVAVRISAEELVSDAEAMRTYFLRTYGRPSTFLPNGAHVLSGLPDGALEEWGLAPGGYYLVACRIEPENNVDLIIREFLMSGTDRQLVIVGGMNYQTSYWDYLQRLAGEGPIRFLGPVYGGQRVECLHLGAYAYMHGHEVGGTNPSLLKAMGCANLALALHNRFNADVLSGTGLLWHKRPGSLAERIRWADANPDEVARLGIEAQQRVSERYTWAQTAEAHDVFFRQIARRRGIRV